jgi:UDP-GlcNAc3NAcA epimerase
MSLKTVCTIIGARPQFIKAAPVSRVLATSVREILIHTGQHYDCGMSGDLPGSVQRTFVI